MMDQRTLNIIYVCKGHTKYWINSGTVLNAIKNYLADECDYKAEWYTDEQIFNIMYNAMRDYLDHCDKPSFFMWRVKDVHVSGPITLQSLATRIAYAFADTQVWDSKTKRYVNGFDNRIRQLDQEELK